MFLYDEKHKPVLVKLSIEDFERFMDKLKNLSEKAKNFKKSKIKFE